jgi:hypothetical protein
LDFEELCVVQLHKQARDVASGPKGKERNKQIHGETCIFAHLPPPFNFYNAPLQAFVFTNVDEFAVLLNANSLGL